MRAGRFFATWGLDAMTPFLRFSETDEATLAEECDGDCEVDRRRSLVDIPAKGGFGF